MDTWDWMPFLRNNWPTIAATTAIVVLAAMAVTLVLSPVYQSTATLSVQPMTQEEPMGLPSASELAARNAGELIKGPNVIARASRKLGASPSSLGATLDFRVAEATNLIAVSAEADDPARAAGVANAVASAFIEEYASALQDAARAAQDTLEKRLVDLRRQIARLQKDLAAVRTSPTRRARAVVLQDQITSAQAAYEQILQESQNVPASQMALATSIQLVAKAQPSTSPVRPRPILNLILSLVGGLFAGLAVARALKTTGPITELLAKGRRERVGAPRVDSHDDDESELGSDVPDDSMSPKERDS